MTVYAIAALLTDRDAYNRYQAAFMDVFQRYAGMVLTADEAPQIVECRLRGGARASVAGEGRAVM